MIKKCWDANAQIIALIVIATVSGTAFGGDSVEPSSPGCKPPECQRQDTRPVQESLPAEYGSLSEESKSKLDPEMPDPYRWNSMVTTWLYPCALDRLSGIRCWGKDQNGIPWVRTFPGDFLSIHSTGIMVCGFRHNKSYECFIGNPPEPNARFGREYSKRPINVESKEFGCWVVNGSQLKCHSGNKSFPETLKLKKPIVDMVAGSDHLCILLKNGQVKCIGSNKFGQLDPPVTIKFSTLAAGGNQTCGIEKEKKQIICWGGPQGNRTLSVPEGTIKELSVNEHQICGLLTSGQLKCWRGSGSKDPRSIPGTFHSIAGGNFNLDPLKPFMCALKQDGKSICFGPGAKFGIPQSGLKESKKFR